jgi:hypothetical protein
MLPDLLLLVHDFVLLMLLLVLFILFPLEILVIFLMIALFFLRVNILRHVSKGDSRTFSNQILHLANPHDKLSTFMLYPSLGFLSIYRLTLCDPRLGHLSLSLSRVTCRMEVLLWRI